MLGRGTWPPPGSRLPEAQPEMTRLVRQREPTHQLAFASHLRARSSRLSRVHLPPLQKITKLWGNAKIANSLDDVFIAEGGRVVKTISEARSTGTATQPCSGG